MRSGIRFLLLRLANGVSREDYDYANELYHKDREKAEKTADNLVERVEELSLRLDSVGKKALHLNQDLAASYEREATYRDIAVKATLAWRGLEQKAEDALATYAEEIELLREDNQAAYEKLTRLLKTKLDLYNEVAGLKASQDSERRAVTNLQRINSDLRRKKEELDEEVSELNTEIRLLRERLNVSDLTLTASAQNLDAKAKECEFLRSELERLQANFDAMQGRLFKSSNDLANLRDATNASIAGLQEELKARTSEADSLNEKLRLLEFEYEAFKNESKRATDEANVRYVTEIGDLRAKLSDKKREEELTKAIKALVDTYGISEANARQALQKFKTSLEFIQAQIVDAFDSLATTYRNNSRLYLDDVFKLLESHNVTGITNKDKAK